MAENIEILDNRWMWSDCTHRDGLPALFWQALQTMGYTEPPAYVGKEYVERGHISNLLHHARGDSRKADIPRTGALDGDRERPHHT